MIRQTIKFIFSILHSIRKWYWITFKIKTFGVRVLIEDQGKVLLVQHRYNDYWVFPGGSMKKTESCEDVAGRETREEALIEISTFKKVLGSYHNTQGGKDDTVTILIANDWQRSVGPEGFFHKLMRQIEIKSVGWFDINNLPKGTSSATKRRVDEFLKGGIDMRGDW